MTSLSVSFLFQNFFLSVDCLFFIGRPVQRFMALSLMGARWRPPLAPRWHCDVQEVLSCALMIPIAGRLSVILNACFFYCKKKDFFFCYCMNPTSGSIVSILKDKLISFQIECNIWSWWQSFFRFFNKMEFHFGSKSKVILADNLDKSWLVFEDQ